MENHINNNRTFLYCDLELIDYKEAWDLQERILQLRIENNVPDIFLLLEHPHTYTFGKTSHKENLIASQEFIDKYNIKIFEIDRGGDITYHGPGQIVGYPIINLSNWREDSHLYLRGLEQMIINVCQNYGITTNRFPPHTGVWIDNERKIAAIGVKIKKWITMHGFAFNFNTDLEVFKGIIPCGIKDKDVTSIEREISHKVDIQEGKELLVENFKKVFNYNNYQEISKAELLNIVENGFNIHQDDEDTKILHQDDEGTLNKQI
ncbi:MAG TPA: lipoyl(octanoyl) transferase LipB [Candidatus Kapabacteria bacterium]|nr:lipoyl(octanoyl) transferase LipB [Candidatus Kapabacteria bacterium]